MKLSEFAKLANIDEGMEVTLCFDVGGKAEPFWVGTLKEAYEDAHDYGNAHYDRIDFQKGIVVTPAEINLEEGRLPASKAVDPEYGIPETKSYPMWNRMHVLSAIKLFGHCDPKYQSELASAIKGKMKKYGIGADAVGADNPLKKYLGGKEA